MDFSSPAAQKKSQGETPFDIQGFKNLLETLRESKEQNKSKAKPVYNLEE